MKIELGLPLPMRKDYFEKQRPHSTWSYPVNFMGGIQRLPVIRIPIGMTKYRLANGRTVSMQQEYLAQHAELTADFFSKDLESEEAQIAQHGLLKKLIKNKDLYEHFRSPKQRQEQPIILDENGFVINGNRRLCAWRELFEDDADTYEHYKYIEAIVLPPCNEKAIDELEAQLQVVPDIKDDYEWHSLAIMMENRRNNHGFAIDDLASMYAMTKKDVQILLDALEYARDYLKKRGKDHQWSQVSQQEHSFKRIVENRNGLDAGAKKLFEESSFVLIDDPEGGRVYEAIRLMKKHFQKVEEELKNEFEVNPEAVPNPTLVLLGGCGIPSIDMSLAEEVGKEPNREKAREIIREVISSQEQLDKDKQSATFLLKRLQKANSLLIEACSIGLKPESLKTGVKGQVESIEYSLTQVKRWLGPNA
jgi:hypothetical protein